MSVLTEVETPAGIRSIAFIAMSIDTKCDSEWSPREYFDYSHDKKYGSLGRVYSGEETESFDEAINALDGHLG